MVGSIELRASFLGVGACIPAGGVDGACKLGVWLFEVNVAFAWLCWCGVETLVAFARSCPCGVETLVAFAGEKWVFVVCFSVAVVMPVSVVVVQG